MEVESFYWTEVGMRPRGYGNAYIEAREVERLLEEAHARGFREGRGEARESAADLYDVL
jgi:hypothetical protein